MDQMMIRLPEKVSLGSKVTIVGRDGQHERTLQDMADYVDTFFLVENGLKNPTAEEFLASHDNAFVTRGRIVDGWVQGMRCLLAALA